jgi:hypothetical protein
MSEQSRDPYARFLPDVGVGDLLPKESHEKEYQPSNCHESRRLDL